MQGEWVGGCRKHAVAHSLELSLDPLCSLVGRLIVFILSVRATFQAAFFPRPLLGRQPPTAFRPRPWQCQHCHQKAPLVAPRPRFLQGFGVEPSPPPPRRAPKRAAAGWAGVEQVTQALTCRICSQAGAFNPFLPEFEGAAVLPSRSESCNACQCWGHHC